MSDLLDDVTGLQRVAMSAGITVFAAFIWIVTVPSAITAWVRLAECERYTAEWELAVLRVGLPTLFAVAAFVGLGLVLWLLWHDQIRWPFKRKGE